VMMPAYLTNATVVLKNTSLASLVTVTEVTSMANSILTTQPQATFKVLAEAGAIYVVVCSLILVAQYALARRWRVSGAR
jgi:ABC-type amino acid transport system permease subunit